VFVDGEMAGAAPLRFPRLHDHALAFTGVGKMQLPPGLPAPPPHQVCAHASNRALPCAMHPPWLSVRGIIEQALAARPFHGQLGMVYMFEDALCDPQVALLHRLGPNYQAGHTFARDAALGAPAFLEAAEPIVVPLLFCLNAQVCLCPRLVPSSSATGISCES
jgi:hypothetical protein